MTVSEMASEEITKILMVKPTISVSDQGRHKLTCTVTETGWRLESGTSRQRSGKGAT